MKVTSSLFKEPSMSYEPIYEADVLDIVLPGLLVACWWWAILYGL